MAMLCLLICLGWCQLGTKPKFLVEGQKMISFRHRCCCWSCCWKCLWRCCCCFCCIYSLRSYRGALRAPITYLAAKSGWSGVCIYRNERRRSSLSSSSGCPRTSPEFAQSIPRASPERSQSVPQRADSWADPSSDEKLEFFKWDFNEKLNIWSSGSDPRSKLRQISSSRSYSTRIF